MFRALITGLLAFMVVAVQSMSAYAREEYSLKSEKQTFSLMLGASRVVYVANSTGSTLSVLNEHDYPMLVQSEVVSDEGGKNKSSGRFSVVPPLFRLDEQQRAKIRIIHRGGEFPDDRESLYWLCVKGIPPKDNDGWSEGKTLKSANLNVQVSIKNCIKLIVRPKVLVGQSSLSMAERLSWRMDKQGLTAVNDTPFYINLSSITVGGNAVKPVRHIAPFASHTFPLPAGASGEVQWRAISDLGGEGPLLRTTF